MAERLSNGSNKSGASELSNTSTDRPMFRKVVQRDRKHGKKPRGAKSTRNADSLTVKEQRKKRVMENARQQQASIQSQERSRPSTGGQNTPIQPGELTPASIVQQSPIQSREVSPAFTVQQTPIQSGDLSPPNTMVSPMNNFQASQFPSPHNSGGSANSGATYVGLAAPPRQGFLSSVFTSRDPMSTHRPANISGSSGPMGAPAGFRNSFTMYSQSALNSIISEDRQKQVGSSISFLFSPVNLRPGLRGQGGFMNGNPHGSGSSVSTVGSAISQIPGPPAGPPPPPQLSMSTQSTKRGRNDVDTGPRKAIFSVSYAKTLNTKPYVMVGIFSLCFFMLVVEIVVNGGFEPLGVNVSLGPSAYTMLRLGAKLGYLVRAGDWWRLITPVFLHAGILHLLFNMLALRNIGVPAEREFGHVKIFAIFIFSGVFGILLSTLFAPGIVGVGASGGIFGLFGACWADLVQNWRLYRQDARSALTQLSFMTILNFVFGLIPFIDNFAHMGGMISGFIMGLFLLIHTRYSGKGERKALYPYQRRLQIFGMIAYPFAFVTFTVFAFVGVDLSLVCPGCLYITCIPLPLWDCAF